MSDFNTVQVADGLPEIINSTIKAGTKPGLGLTLKYDVIGDPIFTIGDPEGLNDVAETDSVSYDR